MFVPTQIAGQIGHPLLYMETKCFSLTNSSTNYFGNTIKLNKKVSFLCFDNRSVPVRFHCEPIVCVSPFPQCFPPSGMPLHNAVFPSDPKLFPFTTLSSSASSALLLGPSPSNHRFSFLLIFYFWLSRGPFSTR